MSNVVQCLPLPSSGIVCLASGSSEDTRFTEKRMRHPLQIQRSEGRFTPLALSAATTSRKKPRPNRSSYHRCTTRRELTMRAITIDAYKTQPHVQEMPRPQPGEGEILIRLHAAGVNAMDWRARDGTYQQWWPAEFPAVLGFDGAGVVEQVGPGVSAFQPGDDGFCPFMAQRVLHWGTYADYVVTSASGAVAPKPVSPVYLQPAPLPIPSQAALSSLDALEFGSGQ